MRRVKGKWFNVRGICSFREYPLQKRGEGDFCKKNESCKNNFEADGDSFSHLLSFSLPTFFYFSLKTRS